MAYKDRWGGTALDDAIRENHLRLAESLAAYFKVQGHEVPESLWERAKAEAKKLQSMVGVKDALLHA